jgi:predicted ArsR family transcriptional regulator
MCPQEGVRVTDHLSERAASIGALAEPLRSALYTFVAAQPGAVSREQAAEGIDVPLHTAKFHLDRLVQEGLLDVEFRRLTGRSGPGAGRPAKLYRRSGRELVVSLPERRYDVVGEILAGGVDRARRGEASLDEAVEVVATEHGRRAAAEVVSTGPDLDRVCGVLAAIGYEPVERDGSVVLVNCPFDALARAHTELVCGVNAAFVTGVVDALECSGLEAALDPEDGLCCVKVRPSGP